MKRKLRRPRRARILAGIITATAIAAAIIIALSGTAGGNKGAHIRQAAASVPALRLPSIRYGIPPSAVDFVALIDKMVALQGVVKLGETTLQESGPATIPAVKGDNQITSPAALPASTHDTPPVITQAGTGEAADSLDIDRSWIYDYLESVERDRQHRRMVWRIDTYLAHRGSPMQGCGEYYVRNAERTGIPACLPVGIAAAESTDGMQTYRSHTSQCPGESYNAWGMVSSRFYGGFGSWENGIYANFDWLVQYYGCPQSMYDCHGYCEGNTTMRTVDGVQRYIEGIDAEWIQ